MRRRLVQTVVVALVVLGLALVAAACGKQEAAAPAPAAPEPPVSQIAAGVGLKTIVGAAFGPRSIVVPVGSTVTWTNASDEGHQVTFFVAGAPLPAGSARAWAKTVDPGATAQVDGTKLVHTGVMTKGDKVNLTFTKAGQFQYFCPIHVGMDGIVQVVEAGKLFTTVSEGAAMAKKDGDALLALVAPTRQAAMTRATKTTQSDGTTVWTVPVGPKVPAPAGYLELKEYLPAELKVKKGDTVRWVFESTHSVTFLPPGTQLPSPAPPATKPSNDYDGKSLYTSSPIGLDAQGRARTFELRFPNAGAFDYICQLHWQRLGHVGKVVVE